MKNIKAQILSHQCQELVEAGGGKGWLHRRGPEEVPRTGRGHRAPCCQNFSLPMESPRETKTAEGGRRKRIGKGLEEVQLCLFPLVYTHITPTPPALSLPCFSCRGRLWQRLQMQRGQDVLPAAHRRAGSYKHLQSRTPGQAARVPHSPSARTHPFPSPTSRGASDCPCFISPSLLSKGALSTSLATQGRCS